jgi:hypothetical protein
VVFVNTAPASQKNFALLRNEDLFYQRFANTNKVVKTSATASSRGGETSNLDLTRFNTTLDYTVAYLGREQVEGKDCHKFELKARNRKLAYGLVQAWIEVQPAAVKALLLRGGRQGLTTTVRSAILRAAVA